MAETSLLINKSRYSKACRISGIFIYVEKCTTTLFEAEFVDISAVGYS